MESTCSHQCSEIISLGQKGKGVIGDKLNCERSVREADVRAVCSARAGSGGDARVSAEK